MDNILITGVSGQDGLFLTSELLKNNKKLKIYGQTRSKNSTHFFNKLRTIYKGDCNNVTLVNIDLENMNDIKNFISDKKPNAIFNLAGPSSVYNSLIDGGDTYKKITLIFDNLIKSITEITEYSPKFFQASSSEIFQKNNSGTFNELSKYESTTPYAKAKLENHLKSSEIRSRYGIDIYSGIMFNHESEFRNNDYLIMKIINSARSIKEKKTDSVELGSLNYIRDWSFAGDMAKAIYKITYYGSKDFYVIGSGKGHSIRNMVETIFSYFGLEWKEHVKENKNLLRAGGLQKIVADNELIKRDLKWSPELSFQEMIIRCIERQYKIKD